MQYNLEIINCDPSIYTKDHPDFIVCSFIEYSICQKRVKMVQSCFRCGGWDHDILLVTIPVSEGTDGSSFN